ncbi:hypothetical protein JOE32_003288 [Pseudomonas sp. PvP025]|nr:hypothetical protein [Pseudomonas sp. PvP025]MDQ0400681.1 hypothetical protein [Pseudomonas sp. PvP006]
MWCSPSLPQVLLNFVHRQRLNLAPRPVGGLPDDLNFLIRHLQQRADLVGVEVVELLDFTFALI